MLPIHEAFIILQPVRSILLLRLSSLGDIVLTTPLIAALRERYSSARIDLAISSEYESLVPVIGGVSRVHLYNKRTGREGLHRLHDALQEEKYDWVLDLHNVHRTRLLRRGLAPHISVIDKRTFRRWLLVTFKYDTLRGAPDVIGRNFETAKALDVRDNGNGPILNASHRKVGNRIAIAPGARHWNKRWPTEYYQTLCNELLSRGFEITFYGSSAEVEVIRQIRTGLTSQNHRSLAGEIDLMETAHSIAKCAVAVTNDSGLMHVAEAVGTPVVSIFGPTVRQFGFAPRSAQSVVVEIEGLYCRPCTAIGSDHCPEKHFCCMKEITPERVLLQILQIEKLKDAK